MLASDKELFAPERKMENRKKKIKCEIYRDIKGYEGFYQISNYGNIKSLRNNKLLIQTNHKGGYKLVSVSVDGMHRELTVHRLVAQAFIPNPNNYRDVNHKDGNKANNHVDNLEWVTHSDNIKHSYNSLNQRRNDVAVVCIETGVKYQSCKVASELTGINKSSINHAINGVARKAGGYTWARS